MDKASRSIWIFGWYSLLMGSVLLFIPGTILPLLKLPYEGGAWIHLLGFVLTCSSYYYLRAAKKGNLDFALATVHTRLAAPIVVIGLYISDQADWHFLSFGLIDGFGGLWTLFELKKALKK